MSDYDSTQPLYLQVADRIRRLIESGEFAEGSSIGSNIALMERFGVSRVTLRHAIKVLEGQGLVKVHHGKGTYVSGTGISQELGDLLSLGEIVEAQGLSHRVRIAEFKWVIAPEPVASFFRADEETPVLRVKRQHIVNDLPLALAIIYIPVSVGVHITQSDLEAAPLYTVMEQKLGVKLGRAVQTISAVAAESDVASLLNVANGYPLLVAERHTSSDDGVPVEHITFYYRSDCYQFTVNLQRAKTLAMVVPPFPVQSGSNPTQEGGERAYVAASLNLSRDLSQSE